MYKFIEKPWGSEEILEINEQYMLKRLTMKKNHRCSLQYHNKKCETIYVVLGELMITEGESTVNLKSKIYKAGETVTITPKIIHRMEGVTDCTYLEASTPDTDDTVRLSDDYNRK